MLNRKHLVIPYFVFLLSFVLTPIILIVLYSFTTSSFEFTFKNYLTVFTQSNVDTLVTSLVIAFMSTALCLIIGYPLAYLLADRKVNKSTVLVYFFVMPMLVNFVLRANATKELFNLINLGTETSFQMYVSVIIAMVYDYLPFVILPLYSTMLKLDKNLVEAASDLGANPIKVFFKVIVPNTIPGIISAATMVFMPSMCSYVISDVFSNQKLQIMGNLINQYFNHQQWNYGSAASIVLLVILFILMRYTNRANKQLENKDEGKGGKLW